MTIRLRHGDARKLLLDLPAGSIDCIVTDPPYPTIGGGNRESGNQRYGRPSGMLSSNNGKGGLDLNDIRFSEYLHDLYRVLRDPGHMYLMVNFHNLETALAEIRRAGFGLHTLLVARKNNVTPSRWYMKNVEYTIFARKGAAFPIRNFGSKVCHDWTNPVGNKHNPNEKSVELMRLYVENSTTKGEIVLDPFSGSGSVGLACQETGRRFIGFEADPAHYLTACRRLRIMP